MAATAVLSSARNWTEMANNFIKSLQKVADSTTGNPVVSKEGRNGGTYAVRLVAQRYCGLSFDGLLLGLLG